MGKKTIIANIKGPKGERGPQGPKGDPGEGLPVGGNVGQVLVKKSENDFDAEWMTHNEQNMSITVDETPTQGSKNPVQSGAMFDLLLKKQNKLNGTEGQIVGFDENGDAIPIDNLNTGGASQSYTDDEVNEAIDLILFESDMDGGDTI